jgi:hypothetical protein
VHPLFIVIPHVAAVQLVVGEHGTGLLQLGIFWHATWPFTQYSQAAALQVSMVVNAPLDWHLERTVPETPGDPPKQVY